MNLALEPQEEAPAYTREPQDVFYAIARTYHINRCRAEHQGQATQRRSVQLGLIAKELGISKADYRRLNQQASLKAGQCFRELRMGRLKNLML